MRIALLFTALIGCLAGSGSAARAQPKAPPPIDKDHAAKMAKGLELFQKQVRPVLAQKCLSCHGGKETEGGLDVSERARLLKGGESGPAIIVGKAKESLLYKLITHAKEPHMPQSRPKLPDEAIRHIADWIDLGAPYDGSLVPRKEPAWTQKLVADDARQFWSFQPLRRTEPPAVKNAAWCRTPIDRFILAKQEAAGLAPNPPATKRQLIRRAYFDLLGLPPAPEELERALRDESGNWYETLVNKLLQSPHYGERWARHWLDLARFAESHGFEHDYDRLTAYHYRDFVIQALNQDLPYDRFVQWQLAGDEYEPDNPLALMATGFLAAGVHSTQITKNEVEKHRYDEMDDMLATAGTAMLGLTIGCARCHDHKFDPIPQRDYYRLLATFTTTVRSEVELNIDPAGLRQATADFEREQAKLVEALTKFEAEQLPKRLADWEKANPKPPEKTPSAVVAALQVPAAQRSPEQLAALLKWFHAIDPEWKKRSQQVRDHYLKPPRGVKTLISTEGLPPVRLHSQGDDFFKTTYFLRRGDPEQKEGEALQGFLQVLMPGPDEHKRWQTAPLAGWRTSLRRRAFADWLTDVDNGAGRLLARVIVNRLWQHHLGKGLVATPSDFGSRGERPSHPELLDWLATELIKNGWRLKPIHQLIMTSAVYQQGAQLDEAKARVDRDNRLCWRRPGRRLEGEVVRDSLLAVSGLLDGKMFGPGTLDEASKRRSIYFTVKRSKLMPMLQVFDAPDALGSVGERPTTTIAPQALWLLNNPQVRGYARGFARRLAADASAPLEDAIKNGYWLALARRPGADELADSLAFVQRQLETHQAGGKTDARELALADFGQVLFCLNEFVYVD